MHPPNGETPESWLERSDSTPTLIPEGLPVSDRMVLIVVIEGPDGETFAVYVGDVVGLATVSDPRNPWGLRRLFFTVPRAILQEPGICPGLGKVKS